MHVSIHGVEKACLLPKPMAGTYEYWDSYNLLLGLRSPHASLLRRTVPPRADTSLFIVQRRSTLPQELPGYYVLEDVLWTCYIRKGMLWARKFPLCILNVASFHPKLHSEFVSCVRIGSCTNCWRKAHCVSPYKFDVRRYYIVLSITLMKVSKVLLDVTEKYSVYQNLLGRNY